MGADEWQWEHCGIGGVVRGIKLLDSGIWGNKVERARVKVKGEGQGEWD